MSRFLFGIVFGLGAAALLVAAGWDWPPAIGRSSESADLAVRQVSKYYVPQGPLVVHSPVPHPAILAAGQLFISLYVLIAQHGR